MWKNTFAIIAFIGACLVATTLILLDPQQIFQTPSKDGTSPLIGKIVETEGHVQTQLPRTLSLQKLTGPRGLHALETLETGEGSSSIVEFPDNLRLKLFQTTKIIGDFEAGTQGHINVTVLRGQVQVLVDPKDARTSVFQDGVHLTAGSGPPSMKNSVISLPGPADTSPPDEASVIETLLEEPAATPTPVPVPPRVLPRKKNVGDLQPTPGLSNEEITRTLAQQSTRFHRCFIASMNRTKRAKPSGTVWVGFMINTNGKVSAAKVARSPHTDQTLNNCLVEVVGRTIFPSFIGRAISVSEFPIAAE